MAEPKRLATLRTLQILLKYTDVNHLLTQNEIAKKLEEEYGINRERKAVAQDISALKEAGYYIENTEKGCYLDGMDFENAELRLLVDCVLCSQHITAKKSEELIQKLAKLTNVYFKPDIQHVFAVKDWNKTENNAIFYNISMVEEAIRTKHQVHYDYNKYGLDKKLHRSSEQYVSPYQMILHNQHYYLMAYSEYWGNMVFHRMDRISNMTVTEISATDLRSIRGYENGIDYKEFTSAMPYMYTDKKETIVFLADACIVDQIVDWFGKEITMQPAEDGQRVEVRLIASPNAMKHWVLQYADFVEVLMPASLRQQVSESLEKALSKYKDR